MMRTLLSTAASNAPFAAHRATTTAQKQQVIENYHAAMHEAGLTPYNCAWPLIDYSMGGGSKMMDKFWDGSHYILPAEVADEMARWKGSAFMLQHISQTVYQKADMRIAGVRVDDPNFVTKVRAFYDAAEDTIRNLGLVPYVMFDEPPSTPAIATRVMRVAEAVRKDSFISVGMATSAAKAADWLKLDPPFNWWVVRNVGFTDAEGGAHFIPLPGMKGSELWAYTTTGMTAERIARVIASAKAQGATGYLTWTVFKWEESPSQWSEDSSYLFDFPPGGNLFDPKVYPNEKLAILAAAIKDAPPVPLTLDERMTNVERRLDEAGL